MASTTVLAPPQTHVRMDERGIPFVDGTTFRVEWLVNEHLHWGWTPEEMVKQHPGGFTVAQANAALAYYFDNREAMDRMVEEHADEMRRIEEEIGETPLKRKLREARHD